jgi:hypothetical protein
MKKAHLVTEAISVCFTAAVIGELFYIWLTTPFPNSWTLQKARLLGFIGIIIVGILSRFWIRKSRIIIAAGAIGILCSAAWLEYRFSDTGIEIIGAAIYSVEIWWKTELFLIAFLVGSWFLTDYLLKKNRGTT